MHRHLPTGIGLLAMLLCAVAGLGISLVGRNTAMTELRVDFERLQAVHDSLTISNLKSRLDLVTAVRPDKVYQVLAELGFAVPTSSELRFVLFPKPVSVGQGGLTTRLGELVVTKERHQTSTTGQNWSTDVPQSFFILPDSGRQDAG
jgi:hypothetical protein